MNPTGMQVIYAGQSRPRLITLQDLLPANIVSAQSADPEPLLPNVSMVAVHKVGVIDAKNPHNLGDIDVIIGVDSLTLFPLIENEKVVFRQHGKVSSAFDVPRHFHAIRQATNLIGEHPGYSVVTHSALLHRNEEFMLFEAPSTVDVILTQEAIEKLATNDGLLQYLVAFHRLYDGILDPKMVLEKISAGIDLLPLVYMRAVRSINGILFQDPRFPEALRYATYIVTVGIAPELLQLLGVQRNEIIPPGSFIDELTKRALKGYSKSL
ncbi:hypothetical protein HY041_02225 [Candidatus Roizmanbacteria bacterium]|nr:hypothetical protein [Candidatus Roizmanbacteria bacterium]